MVPCGPASNKQRREGPGQGWGQISAAMRMLALKPGPLQAVRVEPGQAVLATWARVAWGRWHRELRRPVVSGFRPSAICVRADRACHCGLSIPIRQWRTRCGAQADRNLDRSTCLCARSLAILRRHAEWYLPGTKEPPPKKGPQRSTRYQFTAQRNRAGPSIDNVVASVNGGAAGMSNSFSHLTQGPPEPDDLRATAATVGPVAPARAYSALYG